MKWIGRRNSTPGRRRNAGRNTDMAHRRSLVAGRLVAGLLAGSAIAVILSGVVFLSNKVTSLRSEIASLENRKCCLEAASADLQVRWNRATQPAVIRERASAELGLVDPGEPALVLVRADRDDRDGPAAWASWLERIGGGADALASEPAADASAPRFVSLVPRSVAGTVR